MPTPKLPKTVARLSTASTFYALREDSLSLNIFSPVNFLKGAFSNIFSPRQVLTDIQRQMVFLDGVVSFTENQQRTLDHRYEVDSNVRGQPLEVLGGTVSRDFRIKRIVTYKSDIIKSLGFEEEIKSTGTKDAGLLANKLTTPFIFIKRDASPEGSGIGPIVTFYRGCLIQSISRTLNVEGSTPLAVYEDVAILYAGRQQFTSNL